VRKSGCPQTSNLRGASTLDAIDATTELFREIIAGVEDELRNPGPDFKRRIGRLIALVRISTKLDQAVITLRPGAPT
jgi:hypothetical protein